MTFMKVMPKDHPWKYSRNNFRKDAVVTIVK